MINEPNIIISGYGKMGHAVEEAAAKEGINVVAKLDTPDDWNKLSRIPEHSVVIDFSMPQVVKDNILRCFELQLPVVVGTTGWYDHLDEITAKCKKKGGSLLYAPNFSIGVHVLFYLNRKLAEVMAQIKDYRAVINETHHIHKLDAPSGTAIQLAQDIIGVHPQYRRWVNAGRTQKEELEIFSFREDEIPGTHEVVYDSDTDKIVLKHEAKSREGFAKGALLAARFLLNKKGVYTINDLLKTLGL